MKIISNCDIPLSEWRSLLETSPYTNPFQTPEFYELINSIPNYSAEVFALESDGQIQAIILVTIQKEQGIKRYFSQRGIVYGGPLILSKNENNLNLLLNSIINKYKRRLIYLEIRNFFDYSIYKEKLIQHKWDYLPYLNSTIAIKGNTFNDILSAMKYNRRREIRLSIEIGAFYKECETEEELQKLYNILIPLYKFRVKLPLPEYHFFTAIWKSQIGKVFVVLHDNNIIGGSFCFIQPKKSIYTMYYCGLRNYNKKIFPTHLAVIAAIDYGINHDINYLDFMGAGTKDEEYGVRKYKQAFGGTMNEYGRYRCILKPFCFKVGLIGLEILGKLKK